MLVYGLSFSLPIAFVTHNILKVFVALNVFRTDNVGGIFNNLLWDSRLTRNFYGK